MTESDQGIEWSQLEWLPGPLFIVNADSLVLRANRFALSFLALSGEKDLIGKKLNSFYQYPEEWAVVINRLKEERSISDFEVMYRDSNGERLVAIESMRIARLAGDGKKKIFIVGRDISRRLQVENELMNTNMDLLQLNTRLQDMQKQLVQEKNMSSLGTMAAGIAHEMNNPLGFVMSNQATLRDYIRDILAYISELEETAGRDCIELVKKLRKKHDIEEILGDIHPVGEEIDRGLRRVLDIVKSLDLFTSPVPSESQYVSLSEAVKKALVLTRAKKDGSVELDLQLEDVPKVLGSMQELVQSFINILINAFEAAVQVAPGGSSKKAPFLRIATRSDRSWVYCDFENSGPPIAEDHIPKLFDPFFTTKAVGQGPGLGLTAVYHTVVLKYHGHVDVHSNQDTTMFTVRLPVPDEEG